MDATIGQACESQVTSNIILLLTFSKIVHFDLLCHAVILTR